LRRKNAESLDPQVLLEQAHAHNPQSGGFRLTVQDVFAIAGRGTVVTGRIESGAIRTGATLRQTRPDGTVRDVTLVGIEMFRKTHDSATAGDNVGLLLRDVGRHEIGSGDVLTA
jgi:elongation factor Tu